MVEGSDQEGGRCQRPRLLRQDNLQAGDVGLQLEGHPRFHGDDGGLRQVGLGVGVGVMVGDIIGVGEGLSIGVGVAAGFIL